MRLKLRNLPDSQNRDRNRLCGVIIYRYYRDNRGVHLVSARDESASF
jgi:hypothetical protein